MKYKRKHTLFKPKRRNKIALVTTYYYPTFKSDDDRMFFEICINSHRIHALQHNYDHIILDKQLDEYPHPAWYRFEIYNILNKYDTVLYLDADIYIRENADSPINHYKPNSIVALDSSQTYPYMVNKGILYSREYRTLCNIAGYKELFKRYNMNERRYINSGVMIIPRKYKHIFSKPDIFVNHKNLYEQTLINTRLSTMNIPFTSLDRKWNAGHIHRVENMDYAVEHGQYIHFNMGKNINRYEILKKYLKRIRNVKPVYINNNSKNIIIVFSIDRPDVLSLSLPYLEAYVNKYKIDLKVFKTLPEGCPHPKFALFTECGKSKYDIYDRMLILDDDIIIKENASDIFQEYSDKDKFYAMDESLIPPDSKGNKIDIEYFNNRIEDLVGEYVNWKSFHMNGGVQLSSPQHRVIYRLPDYDVLSNKNRWYRTRIVKNQPFFNYQLIKHKIDVGFLDFKWNMLCSEVFHDDIPDAYFIHLTGRNTGIPRNNKLKLYKRFIGD